MIPCNPIALMMSLRTVVKLSQVLPQSLLVFRLVNGLKASIAWLEEVLVAWSLNSLWLDELGLPFALVRATTSLERHGGPLIAQAPKVVRQWTVRSGASVSGL